MKEKSDGGKLLRWRLGKINVTNHQKSGKRKVLTEKRMRGKNSSSANNNDNNKRNITIKQ
jgi:hypothetical protein